LTQPSDTGYFGKFLFSSQSIKFLKRFREIYTPPKPQVHSKHPSSRPPLLPPTPAEDGLPHLQRRASTLVAHPSKPCERMKQHSTPHIASIHARTAQATSLCHPHPPAVAITESRASANPRGPLLELLLLISLSPPTHRRSCLHQSRRKPLALRTSPAHRRNAFKSLLQLSPLVAALQTNSLRPLPSLSHPCTCGP
jgi:hypothetical protein